MAYTDANPSAYFGNGNVFAPNNVANAADIVISQYERPASGMHSQVVHRTNTEVQTNTQVTNPANTVSLVNSGESFTIGGNRDFGNTRTGPIGEIILFDRVLSETNRQLVEGYLAHRWNALSTLPSNHPYKVNPPFTPYDLSPRIWLDAHDLGSTPVTNWPDRTGNHIDFSQSINNSSAQPTFGFDGLKTGFPAVGFDGIAHILECDLERPFGEVIGDCFVIFVTKPTVVNETGTLFQLTGSDLTGQRWQSHAPWSDGVLYFDVGQSSGTGRISAPYGVVGGDIIITSFYNSPTDGVQEVYKDGELLVGDTSAVSVQVSGPPTIGGGVGGAFQRTSIAEMIVIQNTVPETHRQLLEGYLAHKWELTANLPTNHPYKTSAP